MGRKITKIKQVPSKLVMKIIEGRRGMIWFLQSKSPTLNDERRRR
jgi:hypothetical protein